MKIAVFTKNRSNPAYASARLGADRAAQRFGAQTKHYVPSIPDNIDQQIAQIDEALTDKPDGFVMVPVHPTALNVAPRRIYAAGIPLVGCINRFSNPGPMCYVGSDDYAIGFTLADYLCKRVRQTPPSPEREVRGDATFNIVIVEGAPASPTSIERVRGFEDGLEQFTNVHLMRKICGDYLREPAKRAAHDLLREGVRFDAVLAANDEMGLGMISALDEAGVRAIVASVNAIPEAITAIKEGKLLATIDFNAKDIATIATEALLRHLHGEPVPHEIILPVQVVDASNCERWDKPFEQRPDVEWPLP